MNQCTDLPGSALETVVVAIKLVGYEIKNGPSQVIQALRNETVQKAVANALEEQAKAFLKAQKDGLPIDAKEAARQLGTVAGKAILETGGTEIRKDITKSFAYRKVERSLKNLECAFKKSAMGVWVDEHEKLLIIVASGLTLGAVSAMYVARAGDIPADLIAQLAQKKLKTIHLGSIDVGVETLKFVPSKREVEAKIYADIVKWKAVREAKYHLIVHTVDDKLAALGIGVEVKVPVEKGYYTLSGSADPIADRYSLALGVKGVTDGGLSVQILGQYLHEKDTTTLSGQAGLEYRSKIGKVPFSVTGTADISRTTGPGIAGSRVEGKAMIGLSIPFHLL